MYTSIVDKPTRDAIVQLFTKESQLRLDVATVAFGIYAGVDCKDVMFIRLVVDIKPEKEQTLLVMELKKTEVYTRRWTTENTQSFPTLGKDKFVDFSYNKRDHSSTSGEGNRSVV